ncbi:nucleoside hydrolase, partial [Sutterella parvirubra]
IVMREPEGTVTLVPTGPLTNIALAARMEPRIVSRVKEVVLMGGGYHIGNVRPFAEFNIENDPEAAHIVFSESWKVVMVGLDLTYQARADEAVRGRARGIDTFPGRLFSDVLEAFAINYKKRSGFTAPPVHDPCAVAYVIDPTVVETVPVPISIEMTGTLTRGMTVADFRRPAPEGCHTHAAVKLDQERFWAMVFDAVERLGDPDPGVVLPKD